MKVSRGTERRDDAVRDKARNEVDYKGAEASEKGDLENLEVLGAEL